MYLLYCDESCHLPNDGIDIMILGTVYCKERYKEQIFKDIRKIKEKHSLSPYFEVKWTKVSPAKIELYIELMEYFFENDNLFFRGLVAKGKNSLGHSRYNDGSYNSWYYKMYYSLIDKIIFPDESYRIYVDIKEAILFDSGSNEIKDSGLLVLEKIEGILNEFDNEIVIEGHTDNVPINNALFASNWELSTGRSVAVLRYLTEEGDIAPTRISATGYGEHKPIVENTNPENRAINRRVNILIIFDEESDKE